MKCFVITRDRVTYAQRCVEAMGAAGLDVVIVDHGSTWPPMVGWLDAFREQVEDYGGFPDVFFDDGDRHPRDLWRHDGPIWMHTKPGERYIVTDCDVVPDESCPADWVARLGLLLDRLPVVRKVGLGLRTDDLPDHFEHAARVRSWEAQYQAVDDGGRLHFTPADGVAVMADIDTTLAMYRRWRPFTLGPALRMRPPYVAHHLPWYEDSANPTDEQVYYREHARPGVSNWLDPDGYIGTYGLKEAE